MFKGLIYFLLGFFFIGLIVIYELSVFEKDLDSLIAKYKKEYASFASAELTQNGADEKKVPTLVIIRPHSKQLHHSDQFERFISNTDNERHSIKAFQRAKDFITEVKPTWEQITPQQVDKSKNVLEPVYQIPQKTQKKMEEELKQMEIEAARDSLMRRLAHAHEAPYLENGVPAQTGKTGEKEHVDMKTKKTDEPVQIGKFAHEKKMDTKIGTPFMNVEMNKTAEPIQIGRFAHDNKIKIKIGTPFMNVDHPYQIKESKTKHQIDSLKKKVYEMSDAQRRSFQNPNKMRYNDYLKRKEYDMAEHQRRMIHRQREMRHHSSTDYLKRKEYELAEAQRRLYQKPRELRDRSLVDNLKKKTYEMANAQRRFFQESNQIKQRGNPYLNEYIQDKIKSQSSRHHMKKEEHELNDRSHKIRQRSSQKSYSDTLLDKWVNIHGNKESHRPHEHHHNKRPSQDREPKRHYGKSYADTLLDKWTRLHGRSEPQMLEKNVNKTLEHAQSVKEITIKGIKTEELKELKSDQKNDQKEKETKI